MDTAAPKTSGIYVITNLLDGTQYVGSAVNIRKRWQLHIAQLERGKHHSPYLQRSWNKHGPNAFTFAVLEVVADRTLLIAREQHYLDTLNPAYNCSPTAGSQLGVKRRPETVERMRAASLGKHHSTEARAKMSASRKGMIAWNQGVPCPNHVKELNSKLWKGTKRPTISEALKGHRGWNKGMLVSEETRAKLSAAGKGRPHSEEHKRKIGLAHKGKPKPSTRAMNERKRWAKIRTFTQLALFPA